MTDLAMADAVAIMALVDNAFESASVLASARRAADLGVVRVEGQRGDGWAQFAHAWLAARER